MALSAHRIYVVANGQPARVAVLLPYWPPCLRRTVTPTAGDGTCPGGAEPDGEDCPASLVAAIADLA
jgi:hypothetical protein